MSGTGGSVPALEPVRIRGGDPYQTYLDLEIMGDGLDAFEGMVVTVRLGDPPLYRLTSAQTRVTGGKLSLSLPQVLEYSLYKMKRIHFDVDGDGQCGPGDLIWVDASASSSAPGVAIRMFGSDGTTIRATGSDAAVGMLAAPTAADCQRIAVCGPYDPAAEGTRPVLDMKVVGSGFDAHEGESVRLLTRNAGTGALRGIGRGTVFGGRLTVYLPNGYERAADQEILWFVDVDGDGACNAGAGDQLGYARPVGFNPAGNEVLEVSVTDDPATVPATVDVCSGMQPLLTMAVTGSGFGAHEGATIYVATRTANGAPLAGTLTSISVGGGASFSQLPYAYERTANQQVLWFVDVQRAPAGVCDTSSGDDVGYVGTGSLAPVGNGVSNLGITDNHVDATATNEEICAVMNGCR
jgi:hypothetical protein